MINYYKILDLDNYASLQEVKTAYKDKIRIYHPDINPSEEAEDIAKLLNVAKDHLGTAAKKSQYDRQLKIAYLAEISRLSNQVNISQQDGRSFWQNLSQSERKKRSEEAKAIRAKQAYQASLIKFPLAYRFIGSILLMLWGLQVFYSNYFLMYPGYESVKIAFGIMLFIAGVATTTNEFYKHYSYKALDNYIGINYSNIARFFFFLSIPVGIFLVINLNQYRKDYLLKNHFEYYQASIQKELTRGGKTVYRYTIDGKTYYKSTRGVKHGYIKVGRDKMLIIYAKSDPKIARPVAPDEVYSLPRQL